MQGFSVKLPLTKDNIDGIYSNNKNALEAIKQNFKMLLLTEPGERVMIPNFGVGLKKFLFENNDTFQKGILVSKIQDQIDVYLPMITLEDIIINNSDNNELEVSANGLSIQIIYSIPILGHNDAFSINFSSN